MIRWIQRLLSTSALTRTKRPEPAAGARPIETRTDDNGRRRMAVSLSALTAASAIVSAHVHNGQAVEAFTIPQPLAGVVDKSAQLDGLPVLAMDDQPGLDTSYANAAYGSFFKEGLGFLGYPYLAELSQRAEYRRPVEITAKEMTRKWIKFTVAGDERSDRVAELEKAFKKFRVRDLFKKAAEGDGYFGRAQLFVDTGNNQEPQELMRPLIADPRKVDKGFLKGFRYVEPIWSYPSAFNATDPLEEDFYRPPHWFVQAKTVHTSRLMTFVSRPMPDILKPAYVFGGLALTQMAKPYVDNWLETRQSVNDLIQMFSQPVLKTDMSAVLEGGAADDLMNRVDLFGRTRSNRSTMVIDKNEEDFANVNAPLGSLDKLQAQAQEHMAAVTGIPLVVLLGVTPSGLNASSDGEIKTFYAWIKDMQEQLFEPHLRTVLHLIMLHLWGEIDASIDFEFVPLWEDDATALATIEKTKADTHTAYVNMGAIAPEEVRETLANDDASPYQGVDLAGPAPGPPADPSLEGDPDDEPDGGGEEARPFAHDAEWREGDHPRAENGQFGSGAGGIAGAHAQHSRAKMAIPGEHFSAAAYAGEHNDPSASLESILSHFPPDTARRLAHVVGKVQARGATVDRHRTGGGDGEAAIYTAERQAIQRQVLELPFTNSDGEVEPPILSPAKIEAATPAPGERPTFMILGGRGGSGKSKLAGAVYDPDKFLVLDADKIKERLPEYGGWNANEVHEESSDILERALTFARLNGLNVVLDGTMKSLPGTMRRLEQFKADGYVTESHYMHLPRQEAAKRAVERYLGPTGRFVPPEVVLGNLANEDNFDQVRRHVDKWSFRDNNVPRGESPILISEGAKTPAETDASRRRGRP